MGSNWFFEKAEQVNPPKLSAFGVTLSSRYGQAKELIEMLSFVQELAGKNKEQKVLAVFYDSKASLCSFNPESCLLDKDIYTAALKHISQFLTLTGEHDGKVYHRHLQLIPKQATSRKGNT